MLVKEKTRRLITRARGLSGGMSDLEAAKKLETDSAKKEEKATQDVEKPLKRARSTEDENEGKETKVPQEESKDSVVTKKPKTATNDEKKGVKERDDKATEKVEKGEKAEEKGLVEKPKYVFGSSTAFGNGFGLAKSSAELTGEQDKKKSDAKASPKPFAFGSGLSFGGGFSVLKKKDDKTSESKENDSKDSEQTPLSEDKKEKTTEAESTPSSSDNHGVKLQKQEIISGEEAEETIFQVNAKVYQLADLKEGWKERGVGVIKINRNKSNSKARLVMRSRGILKVILNLPLIKGFKIQQGFPGSLQSEKFIRITTVDDSKAPLQYAVKTGKEETVQELYEKIVDLVPK